jgi:FMN phosphatase YigB (HAD superfamily)
LAADERGWTRIKAESRAAEQQSSRAAEQQSSRAAEQQSSRAAEQQSSRAGLSKHGELSESGNGTGGRGVKIRMVCFDWGGVILRICRNWEEGCAAAGVPMRGRTGSGADAAAMSAARAEVARRYQTGEIDCAAFAAGVAAATGGLYTSDEVRRIHDAWLIAEYPGVDRVVARLVETAGVETGLLSNTNAGHWRRHLPGAGGTRPDFPTVGRLKHRHGSHLLGAAKPGEEIYRLFEERAGVRGPEVLFFDDLAENVETARRVGWRAEQIDPDGDTAGQMEGWLQRYGVFRAK